MILASRFEVHRHAKGGHVKWKSFQLVDRSEIDRLESDGAIDTRAVKLFSQDAMLGNIKCGFYVCAGLTPKYFRP